MTTRNLLRAAALVLAMTVGASAAHAQSPIKLGIAAGLAMPIGETGDVTKAGYNGTVTLAVNAPLVPVGLRVDGMFNELQGGDFDGVTGPKLSVSGVNANLTYNLLPLPVFRVYAIGGVGYYRSELEDFDAEGDLGFNAGLGARFGLGSMQPFVEARYHRVNTGEDAKIEFVPITFGIMF